MCESVRKIELEKELRRLRFLKVKSVTDGVRKYVIIVIIYGATKLQIKIERDRTRKNKN